MRITKNKRYAIVSGDVIASSRLSPAERRRLQRALATASTSVHKAFPRAVPAGATIVGGDGWQMLVAEPALALRASLFFRARLRATMESHQLDTRMVIAVGTVDFLPGDRVSEGDGAAYRLSGRGLQTLGRTENALFLSPGWAHERTVQVIVTLVDLVAARWSDKQALAVTGALRGWTQEKIARTSWKPPISQQAVAQHLGRAGWNGVERAVEYCETVLDPGAEYKV